MLLNVSAYMTGSAMTAAFAPTLSARSAVSLTESLPAPSGAQNLLTLKSVRQNYIAEAVAVGVYALILAAALTYSTTPQQAPAEEPMELVMEAPPPAVDEPKPPEAEALKPPGAGGDQAARARGRGAAAAAGRHRAGGRAGRAAEGDRAAEAQAQAEARG